MRFDTIIAFAKNIFHKIVEKATPLALKIRVWIFQHPKKSAVLGVALIWFIFCLPSPLFRDPVCMVLEDNQGNLLGARIAADGQWRFPTTEQVPEKYAKSLVAFEDKRYYYHWGIDPISFCRAFAQNIKNQRVVSGGSTISMQVIRMARKGQSRSIWEKIIEAIQATRLEFRCSKKEILALYCSNAPYGGNVVGIDAASWRYFGKDPKLMSWAESATLAVLPNSPSLIHFGRNRQALIDKRNRLLKMLFDESQIDKNTYELSIEEQLPEQPHELPRLAPHLLERAYIEQFKNSKNYNTRLKTTIDSKIQEQVTSILLNHHNTLKTNGIHNASAIVYEVETGNIVAYVGNVVGSGEENQEQVDCIKAPRSSGSIFKPILYALGNQEGIIAPNSLISDVPMTLSGYKPMNYFETYDGAIPAKRALQRSLNVPMVRLVQQLGIEKFHFWLKKLGLSTINHPPDYYGLPLALGGAETTLWDITNLYAGMARTVNHFSESDSRYFSDDFRQPNYIFSKKYSRPNRLRWTAQTPNLNAGACYLAFDAMQNVERPTSSGDWQQFMSSKRIAWKTGTSFGFRDAWAVGVNPKYAVGVWVGNADGEGRPDLIGVSAAAPILMDIFGTLPSNDWFSAPYDDLMQLPLCHESGFRAGEYCQTDTVLVCKDAVKLLQCPYHQLLHLDASGLFQVTDACESPSTMLHRPWFVLPPIEEFYYKSKNPNYISPPPFKEGCVAAGETDSPMQLIYPRYHAQIYVPIDLDGKLSRTVFQAAHRNPETTIYWHLDNAYLTSTKSFHNIELIPTIGQHTITLVDEKGNRVEQRFEIIGKK
jgi:penicillin-binding protein 1C